MNSENWQPLVSIVIPVYNGTNYVREAIDSALAQTYPNCEIIVVNDGSTDNGATAAVCKSYGAKIRYLEKPNGGTASAVNFGIRAMRGEYFSWLSHDDIYYPQKIEKQIAALENSGDRTRIVFSNFDYLDMDTGFKSSHDMRTEYPEEKLTIGAFAPVFFVIHGCTILVHKSHFARVGLYDENPKYSAVQDSIWLFHAMRHGASIFLPESLITGRGHKEQGQRTMTAHHQQYNDMVREFCKTLSDEEKISFWGSTEEFYYKYYQHLLKVTFANNCVKYLRRKLFLSPPPGTSRVQFSYKYMRLVNLLRKLYFLNGVALQPLKKTLKNRCPVLYGRAKNLYQKMKHR